MRSRPRALAVLLAAVALASPASRARAGDVAAAEALFAEGKALAAEGRWAEACPKLEASYAEDPALGTLLNWADCLEKQGRLGSALRRFREAEERLGAAADARETLAAERRAALEPRAPRLALRLASPAPAGISVRVGAEPVDLAGPSDEPRVVVVDPGPIVVEVLRGGEVLERRDGEGKEGVVAELTLDLAAIDRAHAPAPAPPPAPPREEPSAVPLVLGWTLVGTGAAALLVAGTLEVVALGEQGDAEATGGCRGELCSPDGYASAQTAGDLAEAGQWVGIAGVGLLAVGITLVLTAPDSDPAPGAAAVRLRAGASRLSLDGRF